MSKAVKIAWKFLGVILGGIIGFVVGGGAPILFAYVCIWTEMNTSGLGGFFALVMVSAPVGLITGAIVGFFLVRNKINKRKKAEPVN